jgi:septal ring factor EnvC (AmiA/AmiB activator)
MVRWLVVSAPPITGGFASWLALLAAGAALLTAAGTFVMNRAMKRRADTEATTASSQTNIDRDRLSFEGLAAYCDRLEAENKRLREDSAELRQENEELRDLHELIDRLRGPS